MKGTVLITGGTGSLGQAILRRAERAHWDASFVVYSRDEVKQATLRERFPAVRYLLGDVRDAESLESAMRGVDVVIHAAAYKRVPEAERETIACVQANVVGSMNVVREALRVGVPRIIGISTDKACQPINAYGQSKALMERLFQSVAHRLPGVAFTLVRYGNVLASTGSVVPSLRMQADSGGPITLTDPAMTRFWLTLDDAVDLIVAGIRMDSGYILIPKSRSSTMAVMAEAVAPGARVEKIGNRGGEKVHEKLINEHESAFAWETDGGFILGPLGGSMTADLPAGFEYRSDTAGSFSVGELRAVLARMDAGEPVTTLPV
jgi:UDP-N-acetylglucosamine 4,6-dehydratase